MTADDNQPQPLLFSGSMAAYERRWRTSIALVRARWTDNPTAPFADLPTLVPADSMALIECLSAIAALGLKSENRRKFLDELEADLPNVLATIERQQREQKSREN